MNDTANMNENFSRTLEFENDQLVVDTQHRDLVSNILSGNSQDRTVTVKAENRTLGLTLLQIADIDQRFSSIEERRPQDVAKLKVNLGESGIVLEPFDVVLSDLRKRMADRFGGWNPEMGKNRVAGVVFGTPGTQGVPVAAFEQPRVSSRENLRRAAVDDNVGKDVQVGMVDTEVDPEKISAEIFPSAGHGTFVRGLIEAQAPGAEVVVKSALSDENATATAWDVAVAMVELVGRVEVLNLSLGCRTLDHRPPLLMTRAVEKLTPKTIIVAAAGNHGADFDSANDSFWPAALPGVVAVGARGKSGALATFSPRVPWVRYLANGVDVVSEFPSADVKILNQHGVYILTPFKQQYASWTGTSFAAATVSGIIAARRKPGDPATIDDLKLTDGDDPVVTPYVWPNNV